MNEQNPSLKSQENKDYFLIKPIKSPFIYGLIVGIFVSVLFIAPFLFVISTLFLSEVARHDSKGDYFEEYGFYELDTLDNETFVAKFEAFEKKHATVNEKMAGFLQRIERVAQISNMSVIYEFQKDGKIISVQEVNYSSDQTGIDLAVRYVDDMNGNYIYSLKKPIGDKVPVLNALAGAMYKWNGFHNDEAEALNLQGYLPIR